MGSRAHGRLWIAAVVALVVGGSLAILSWRTSPGDAGAAARLPAAGDVPAAEHAVLVRDADAPTPDDPPASRRVAAGGERASLDACVVRVVDGAGRPWPDVRVELDWVIAGVGYREPLGRTGNDGRLAVTGLCARREAAAATGRVQACTFEVPCLGMEGPRKEYAEGHVDAGEVLLVMPPAGTWRVELRDAHGRALLQHVPLSLQWSGHHSGSVDADATQLPSCFAPVALGLRWHFKVDSALALRPHGASDADPGNDVVEAIDLNGWEHRTDGIAGRRLGPGGLTGPGFDREEAVHVLELDAGTPVLSGTVRTAAGTPLASRDVRVHVSFSGRTERVRTDAAGNFRCAFPPARPGERLERMWLDELADGEATGNRAHREVSVPVVPGERHLGAWQLEPLPLLVQVLVRHAGGAPAADPHVLVTPADATTAHDWLKGSLVQRRAGAGRLAVHGSTDAARILVQAGWNGRLASGLNRIVPVGTRNLVFELLSDER